MSRRTRFLKRALLAFSLAILAVVGVAYLFFPADRSTALLDRAPDDWQVPAYDDPIFFQGQGFPVRRALLSSGTTTHGRATVFVLPHLLDAIDYKNVQESAEQVAWINATFAPAPPWRFRPERRLGHYKCMSTAASLLLDWFALEHGAQLPTYQSLLDGKQYRGIDPRALDALYYAAATDQPDLFKLTGDDHRDPISAVPVPCSIAAFARLIETTTAQGTAQNVRDAQFPIEHQLDLTGIGALRAHRVLAPTFHWRTLFGQYPRAASERTRQALGVFGPLLAGIKIRFSALHGIFKQTRLGDFPLLGPSGHGVLIVGWVEQDDRLYFLYRETFGGCDEERVDCGPSYRIYPIYGFNEIFAFESTGTATLSHAKIGD